MKSKLQGVIGAFDPLLSLALIPPAYLLKAYRRVGSAILPRTTRMLKRVGVFPIVDHYYEPLFNTSRLRAPLADKRKLPGIDFRIDAQLALLARLRRSDELVALKLDEPTDDPARYSLHNGNFGPGDAEFLYQFIREMKPRRIVEIGSGHSTKIARMAVQANLREGSAGCEQVCIEPYEMPWLEQLPGVRVVRRPVENCGIDWSEELRPGDLLFIDSSHVIRPQGDVLYEYLEILPRLQSGVHVHVHDIFTPRDYPAEWVESEVRLWNEQYLLEALLSNSSRYEVVAALNLLACDHYEALKKVCPYLPRGHGGSFYLRVR